jgi:PQQ-dependent catabolism-associated CXXCW motif protein
VRLALSVLIGASLAVPQPSAWAAETYVPEPKTYRTENYRAPVPASLQGARILTTAGAATIWEQAAAVFIDVFPRPPRPRNLPEGTLWRDKPHLSIPGSVWLPDTGYGELHPSMESYFQTNLERITGGDRGKPLVFYCLKDCWMSWNAAKRAQSWGYSQISWYPEGTDGWAASGLPLEEKQPVPRPGE